jgi:hypothetical protein
MFVILTRLRSSRSVPGRGRDFFPTASRPSLRHVCSYVLFGEYPGLFLRGTTPSAELQNMWRCTSAHSYTGRISPFRFTWFDIRGRPKPSRGSGLHSETPPSVRRPWTSDWRVAETSTWHVQKTDTYLTLEGLDAAIPANERPQNYALHCMATLFVSRCHYDSRKKNKYTYMPWNASG